MRRAVGLLALAVPAGMAIFTGPLILLFDYPGILDAPAPEVLDRLGRAGAGIPASWLGVTLCSLLWIVLAAGLERVLRDEAGPDQRLAARMRYLPAITVTGILAAFSIALDLGQWVWVYPGLGRRYVDPATTAAVRSELEVTWRALHAYVGRGIGIHVATLLSGMWAAGLGWVLLGARQHRRVLPWLAVACGGLFLLSIAPGSSFDRYALVNSAGFVVWTLWLLATGVLLVRGRRLTQASPLAAGPRERIGPRE